MRGADGHLLPLVGVGADGQVDQVAVVIRYPTYDRGVLLLDRALFELGGECQVRCVIFRHDDDSAGIAVQSMDDTRTRAAADLTELLEAERQGGCQRTAPVSASRMDHHPRRFVDDYQDVVFEQNVQRNFFRLGSMLG